MANYKHLTDEQRLEAKRRIYRRESVKRRTGLEYCFTRVNEQPVAHRETKRLPSGAHIQTFVERPDELDDLGDLLKEWGADKP